jgi:hypothetical protein
MLICGDYGFEAVREREQLLKRNVSSGLYGYLQLPFFKFKQGYSLFIILYTLLNSYC